MSHKSMSVAAVVFFAISLGLGLLWWFIGWRTGNLARIARSQYSPFLFALGTLQVLGWALMLLLIQRLARGLFRPPDLVIVGICAGVLLGNIFWYLTPVLGAPLILLMLVLGLISLFAWRKRESIR